MKPFKIDTLIIDNRVREERITKNYLKSLPDAHVRFVDNADGYNELLQGESPANGKRTIFLTKKKGHVLKQCPGTDRSYRCCNYQVINQTAGCPIDCTYCILQFYQSTPLTTVYADTDNIIEEIRQKVRSQPERFFRIGTGELTDSLAFDDFSNFSEEIIPVFAELPNALLELKTKSDIVDSLLEIDHQGNVVCSWSMNPPSAVDGEEFKSAPLEQRLDAMGRVQDHGYKLGLHFDPILYYEHWEKEYHQLIKRLFQTVHPESVAWVSMGSLRFPPDMKDKITSKFPKTNIVYQELIKGNDGKMRYVKPLRLQLYRSIYHWMRKYGGEDLFLYFCMEDSDIWERVMGWSPESNEHLDYLFAESLYQHFPELMDSPPQREAYESGTPLHHTELM